MGFIGFHHKAFVVVLLSHRDQFVDHTTYKMMSCRVRQRIVAVSRYQQIVMGCRSSARCVDARH
jgi:hypothetical protein